MLVDKSKKRTKAHLFLARLHSDLDANHGKVWLVILANAQDHSGVRDIQLDHQQ